MAIKFQKTLETSKKPSFKGLLDLDMVVRDWLKGDTPLFQ